MLMFNFSCGPFSGWCPLFRRSWPPLLVTSLPPPVMTSLRISKCRNSPRPSDKCCYSKAQSVKFVKQTRGMFEALKWKKTDLENKRIFVFRCKTFSVSCPNEHAPERDRRYLTHNPPPPPTVNYSIE